MTPETGARHGRLLVLVHSPLTGPLTWQPVARVLTARGYSAVVPSLVEGLMGPRPYYPRLAARVAEAVLHEARGAREAVLIGHSGAGAILPAAAPGSTRSRRPSGRRCEGWCRTDTCRPGTSGFRRAPSKRCYPIPRCAKHSSRAYLRYR